MKSFRLSLEKLLAACIVLVLFYGVLKDSEEVFRYVFPIAALFAWVLGFVHLYRYLHRAPGSSGTKTSSLLISLLLAAAFTAGAAYYNFFL